MPRLTVDPELQTKLTQSGEPVEIYDQSGRVIGYFEPLPPGRLKELSPFSDEELERRREQRTGRPLKDILKDLEDA